MGSVHARSRLRLSDTRPAWSAAAQRTAVAYLLDEVRSKRSGDGSRTPYVNRRQVV